MNFSRRSFFTRLAGWTAALGLGVPRFARAVTPPKPPLEYDKTLGAVFIPTGRDSLKDVAGDTASKLCGHFGQVEVVIKASDGVFDYTIRHSRNGDSYGTSEDWGLRDEALERLRKAQ